MPFFRPVPIVRNAGLRPFLCTAPRARPQVRYATQDYGSGEGNPVGENPQQQGRNPSENLEHPGPPPPKVAKGKSPSPDEKQSSPNESQTSSSSQSKSSSESGGDSSKGKGSPQPKILNESPPEVENESVRKHNKEFEERSDRAHERANDDDAMADKVSSKFWSGQGGRDREA